MAIPNIFATQTDSIPLEQLDDNFTYLENNKLTGTGGTISGNLTITGDLTVNGTQNIVDVTNLAVEDNMIYLNDGNTSSNLDLGIVGNYNDGVYAHSGIFRDATDGYWKFFDNYTPEPGIEINIADASYSSAPLQVSTVKLNNWTITESGGVLYFAHNGVNKVKIESSGLITTVNDMAAFGSM